MPSFFIATSRPYYSAIHARTQVPSSRLFDTLRRPRIILLKHRQYPIPFLFILIRRRRAGGTEEVGPFRILVRRREVRETQGVGLVPRRHGVTRASGRPPLRFRLSVWSLCGWLTCILAVGLRPFGADILRHGVGSWDDTWVHAGGYFSRHARRHAWRLGGKRVRNNTLLVRWSTGRRVLLIACYRPSRARPEMKWNGP